MAAVNRDIVRQWQEDYDKLLQSYKNLQGEYETVVELNVSYAKIICELQSIIDRNRASGPPSQPSPQELHLQEQVTRPKTPDIDRLEKEKNHLEHECNELKEKIKELKKELEKLRANEQRIFVTLKMDAKSTPIDEAIMKLKELMESKNNKDLKATADLEELNKIKAILNKKQTVEREKSRLEFDIRQKNLVIRRLQCQRDVNPAMAQAKNVLNEAKELLRIATIRARGNDLPALLPDHCDLVDEPKVGNMYCLFCRSECTCEPTKHKFRQHYKAYRNGKWLCCGNESHTSAGCMVIPHCYVIKSVKSTILTDGQQFLLYE